MAQQIESLRQPFSDFMNKLSAANDTLIVTNDMDLIKTKISELIQELCGLFASCDPKRIEALMKQHQLDSELIHELVDTYVSEKTYEIVYFKICAAQADDDIRLSQVIQQIKLVDVCQLGIPWTLGFHINDAVQVVHLSFMVSRKDRFALTNSRVILIGVPHIASAKNTIRKVGMSSSKYEDS